MSIKLIILMICSSIALILLTTHFLRKGRIPEKYALLWYFFAIIVILLSLIPNIMNWLAQTLGFMAPSNMLMLALIAILFLLVMVLTIMIAGQKKKTTLLIQEISILKQQINNK